tara:strand:- start:539 stop:1606 length:1068 start_codon:yes stop_codon:yes gene_type:complete
MKTYFQTDTISSNGDKHIIELAGPLTGENHQLEKLTLPFNHQTKLFLNATPSIIGSGEVASNLRYKFDHKINNNVVRNTYNVLSHCLSNNIPIIISSFDRTERIFTFKIDNEGNTIVFNNHTSCQDINMKNIFDNFLSSVGFNTSILLKIRKSIEGSRYNTYLSDVLSFITQVNYFQHPNMFTTSKLKPIIVNNSMVDKSGDIILKDVTINDILWSPKDNFNYLYFEEDNTIQYEKFLRESNKLSEKQIQESISQFNDNNIIVPLKGSINKVYHQFELLLSLEENDFKKSIRNYLTSVNSFKRFSDYFVNDIDDAITLLAIQNCFHYCNRSDQENIIYEQVKRIINSWFEELKRN